MAATLDRAIVEIAEDDLQCVSEALMARFQLRAGEARRIQHMRALLDAQATLGRALVEHTRHGLVHCQGSRGNSDLTADTAALYAAIEAWSAQLHQMAAEYRSLRAEPGNGDRVSPEYLTAMESSFGTAPRWAREL